MQNEDDDSLIRKYKLTGKMDYLAAVYQRYMNLVYGVCLKYLDEETSKDAVMLIFEELIVKLKQHHVQHFKSWLHVLTRNHCLMKLRAMKNTVSGQKVIDDRFLVENEGIEHHATELENNLRAMEACIETLQEKQKRCIILFYLQEKSYREICISTGYEINKVKSYIQNGKRNLKICIEQQHD